ncbi:MAG: T9SS C-terminal target domain-containing protein [Haliscomenobacteraceae bacterium CHB4]|nr:hypothetical protein [Saprospiraceae bacterium]MCE7921525.1 T9SS C-terminal target domain-containing protein [Haliscomenobacteraceae bacterium CHB4]
MKAITQILHVVLFRLCFIPILMLRLVSANAQTPIAYGESITDTINPASDIEIFSVAVMPGDILWIRVSPVSSLVNPKVELWTPQGSLFASVSTQNAFEMVQLVKTIPNNSGGAYIILVSDTGADDTGRFCISVNKFNSPPNAAFLNCNASLNSTIDCNSTIKSFQYSVQQNAISRIVVSPVSSIADLKVWICTSDGSIIAQDSAETFDAVMIDVTAAQTDCFYVFVGDTEGDNTGGFSISHALIFGSCDTGCPVVGTEESTSADNFPLSIYPNPATCEIFLTIHTHSGLRSTLLTVFDATGRPMLTHIIIDATTRIDVAALPSGYYFLQLQNPDGTVQRGSFVKN